MDANAALGSQLSPIASHCHYAERNFPENELLFNRSEEVALLLGESKEMRKIVLYTYVLLTMTRKDDYDEQFQSSLEDIQRKVSSFEMFSYVDTRYLRGNSGKLKDFFIFYFGERERDGRCRCLCGKGYLFPHITG